MTLLYIVSLVVGCVVQTAFLLLVLWIMVRIQKFQYTFLGLLGSAALASALNLIPFVGRPLAIAALLLCVKAVTRTDFVEVRFTVGVSYALLFGVNLFLVGALMGDLRVSAKTDPTLSQVAEQTEGDSLEDDDPSQAGDNAPRLTSAAGRTNTAVVAAATSPGPAVEPSGVQTGAAPSTGPVKPPRHFVLKGVSQNGSRSLVMIDTGVKTYTFAEGETMEVRTPEGKAQVKLEKIADKSIILNVDGEQDVLY